MASSCRRSSFFPAQIKGALRNWRSGFGTEISDRRINVIQGNLGMGGVATLCFDAQTGLLVRLAALRPVAGRPHRHAGRLQRLPRRREYRREDAVQVDGELARWPQCVHP